MESDWGDEALTYQTLGQASGFKARVVWGTGCMLKGLEGDGAFPLDADGWGEGLRVGMTFPVLGPGRAEAWRQGRAACVLGGPRSKYLWPPSP